MNPYAETARAYLDGGWSPIPLPLGAKEPPPTGYTGRTARKTVRAEDVERWSAGASHNVALRLPDTVIGIDVDAYGDRGGAASLAVAEASYGVLPESPRLTSRDDGVSGIRFYGVPPGSTFIGDVGPGIDVIQHGHRYAVAWPSVHPSGSVYRWLDADGTVRPSVPVVADLPALPGPWLAALDAGSAEAVSAGADVLSVADAQGWLATLVGGQPCRPVAEARDSAVRDLASNRHDSMVTAVWQLVSLGGEGHRGVRLALRSVRDAFVSALAGERNAAQEYARALLSAVRKLDGRTAEPCQCPTLPESKPRTDVRLRFGWDALIRAHDGLPPLWGPPDTPLWARGESLMIVGPPSLGKSTLAQRLALARIGLGRKVLGYPVTDDGGRVVYVAGDRPQQIARGIRRMAEGYGDEFGDRFAMWDGPPDRPLSTEANRSWLTDLAQEVGATTIIVDSIKDAIPSPSDESSAGGYNLARQTALAAGIELIEIHHNRKANGENRAPRRLDDVLGSRLLTAGAGSVLSLWGESGAHEIALTQLKPLADTHPALMLTLDGAAGQFDVADGMDAPLIGSLMEAGDNGLTVAEATRALYGARASKQEQERTRKQLERKRDDGELTAVREGRAFRYFLFSAHLD